MDSKQAGNLQAQTALYSQTEDLAPEHDQTGINEQNLMFQS